MSLLQDSCSARRDEMALISSSYTSGFMLTVPPSPRVVVGLECREISIDLLAGTLELVVQSTANARLLATAVVQRF